MNKNEQAIFLINKFNSLPYNFNFEHELYHIEFSNFDNYFQKFFKYRQDFLNIVVVFDSWQEITENFIKLNQPKFYILLRLYWEIFYELKNVYKDYTLYDYFIKNKRDEITLKYMQRMYMLLITNYGNVPFLTDPNKEEIYLKVKASIFVNIFKTFPYEITMEDVFPFCFFKLNEKNQGYIDLSSILEYYMKNPGKYPLFPIVSAERFKSIFLYVLKNNKKIFGNNNDSQFFQLLNIFIPAEISSNIIKYLEDKCLKRDWLAQGPGPGTYSVVFTIAIYIFVGLFFYWFYAREFTLDGINTFYDPNKILNDLHKQTGLFSGPTNDEDISVNLFEKDLINGNKYICNPNFNAKAHLAEDHIISEVFRNKTALEDYFQNNDMEETQKAHLLENVQNVKKKYNSVSDYAIVISIITLRILH